MLICSQFFNRLLTKAEDVTLFIGQHCLKLNLDDAKSGSRIPGFPHLVSISGKALVNWSIDQILDYLRNGLNHFKNERGVIPSIFLASVQASSHELAVSIAEKIRSIHRFREEFNTN